MALRDFWAQERRLIDEVRFLIDLYAGFAATHPVRLPFCGQGRATAGDDHVSYSITLGREMGCVAVTFTFVEGDGTFLCACDDEPDDESYGVMGRLARQLGGRLVAIDWRDDRFTIEVHSPQLAEAQDAVRMGR